MAHAQALSEALELSGRGCGEFASLLPSRASCSRFESSGRPRCKHLFNHRVGLGTYA